MAGGGQESVIPMVIGMLTFALALAFMISYLAPIMDSSSETPDMFAFGHEYTLYSPSSCAVDWSTNTTDHYRDSGEAMLFTHSGNEVWTWSIRNSTQYVTGSTVEHEKYHNYVMVEDWGGFADWFAHNKAIPYSTLSDIANDTDASNVSYDISLWGTNYTIFVSTGPGDGHSEDAEAFNYNLYTLNKFNITFAEPFEITTAQWNDIVWYILTFNADWIPTYPAIAYLVSFIVDTTILLAGLTIIQRFIP